MRKLTLFTIILVIVVVIAIIVFLLVQRSIRKKTKAENRKLYQDLRPSENIKKFIKCYERNGRIGTPAFEIFTNPDGDYEVGWGHDFSANGEKVTNEMLKKTYTLSELNELFEKDLQKAHKRGLLHFENIYMTQEMYDALISYLFNTKYPKNVTKLLKSGADYNTIAEEWINGWTLSASGGNYFRRLAERDIFLTGDYVVYKQKLKGSPEYTRISISEVKY